MVIAVELFSVRGHGWWLGTACSQCTTESEPRNGPMQTLPLKGDSHQQQPEGQPAALFSFRQLPDGALYLVDLHDEPPHIALRTPSLNIRHPTKIARQEHDCRFIRNGGRHDCGAHQHLAVLTLRADEIARRRQLPGVLWRTAQVAYGIVSLTADQGGRTSRFNYANQQAGQHATPSLDCCVSAHRHAIFLNEKAIL